MSPAAFLSLEFAAPAALWGLTAAVPIVLLHLYFRRRKRIEVPFVVLLEESRGPVRREARFKRVRDALALAARLAALGCAVLALGGLRPVEAQRMPRALFLVVDADVSTAAREEGGVLRLGLGLARAQDWVRSLPAVNEAGTRLEAPVSAFLAERTPRLLVAPTRDRPRALELLGRLPVPAATTTDLEAAVAMALESAASRTAAHLVVITTRPLELDAVPEHVDVTVQGMGAARKDQGLFDFAVARSADGAGYQVGLQLRNQGEAPAERDLVVRVGDDEVARRTVALGAGADEPVTLELPAPHEGAWLQVALEGQDVFPANDGLEAWLAPLPRPSVLVAHGGAVRPYTAAMLEALVRGGFVDEEASGYVRVAKLAQAAPRDVVIVDGVSLAPEALRPGAYVFLAPLGGALPFDLGPAVEDPLVWRTLPHHPLMRDLDFRRAYVVRGRALTGAGLRPLAFAEGRAVIAEGERDDVRYVVLGLDPEESALPYQVALPMLVRKAVARLARAPRTPLAPFYRRGAVLRPAVPLPGGAATVVSWSGHPFDPVLSALWQGQVGARLAPEGAAWHVPSGAVGRVEIASRGATWRGRTAFVDPDLGRHVVPVREPGVAPPAAAGRSSGATRWRRGLLAAALIFLLLDLALLRRRRPAHAAARA